MMSNNIGYSSIFPKVGIDNQGPIGPIGPTGPAQTVPGNTGATGTNSNYITQVIVNKETGIVEFVLSDNTVHSPGSIIGVTGIYAGLTAISVGSGYPILKGVCGGITLDFYNIRTGGLLGVTTDTDGSLKVTISANTTAGGISASTQRNRIVYVKEKNYIMSTELIPESVSISERYGNTAYGFVNFGGETGGRNVVAEITERELSLGPIFRGEKKITIDDFYQTGVDGITLDVSRAPVYRITTPIGIKAFSTSNLGTIPNGQILSVTLFIEGDDVWNFPTDVYFDEESKPVFYPGMNILHMWKSSTDANWYAHFVARGYDVSGVNNPGTKGSCCYSDIDGLKFCEDYVSEHYCNQLNGTFAALLPCSENPCNLNGQTPAFNGICCSEGRCISDLDPNTCQAIGGYYIDGITCGDYGTFPDSDVDNVTTENGKSGMCYNTCKTPTTCCKNGECLGQLTQAHCEDLLGGISVVGTDDCGEANCCDRIDAPGACCTPSETSGYVCTDVASPAECRSIGGVYMGKNTSCSSSQIENICCTIPLQCWECPQNNTQGDCGCVSKTIFTNGGTCEENGYFTDKPACDESCNSVVCHKCQGTDCVSSITVCATTGNTNPCPSGYTQGPCACNRKTCYNTEGCFCDQHTFVDIEDPTKTCADLSSESGLNYPDEECTRPEYCGNRVACFWCFPTMNQYDSTGRLVLTDGTPIDLVDIVELTRNTPVTQAVDLNTWKTKVKNGSYAPYRSVALVSEETADALENSIKNNILPTTTKINLLSGIEKTIQFEKIPDLINPPSGGRPIGVNKYYPFYFEHPEVEVDHYYNLGEQIEYSVSNQPFPETTGPIYSVGDGSTSWKCYYVSNYQYNPNETETEQKKKCLTAIGYDVENSSESKCEICDLLPDITVDNMYLPETTGTFTNFEPYNEEMKNRKLFAPFPPVWGRVTFNSENIICQNSDIQSYITDTAALGGLISPLSNAAQFDNVGNPLGYGGLYLMLDFAHGRGQEPKIKNYWRHVLDIHAKSFDDTGNNIIKNNDFSLRINSNLSELMGRNSVNPFLVEIPKDSTGANYNQFCLPMGTSETGLYTMRFDPYLLGLSYQSLNSLPPSLRGLIVNDFPQMLCAQCYTYDTHWHFSPIGDTVGFGRVYVEFQPSNQVYYPMVGSYVVNGSHPATLAGVGEIYSIQIRNYVGKLIPAIYGRNIRYNLDSFRTASVFYNDNGTKTMNYSNTTVIPIRWINYLSCPVPIPDPCLVDITSGGNIICVDNPCGGGDEQTCTCCKDGSTPPNKQCSCISGNDGGTQQPPGECSFGHFGYLAPSTPTQQTSGGGGGPGFNFRSADSSITTKRVELIPGVCVDMKCPECNNYKSC